MIYYNGKNMHLRITGGKLKGKKIFHKYKISIRPTSSKVRESIFNRIINSNLLEIKILKNNIRFTDIFCGSGIIGFEALSRNFDQVTFIDNNEILINSIYKNAYNLNLHKKIDTFCANAITPPKAKASSDIIFLDPPYNSGISTPTILALEKRGWISNKTTIFVETSSKEELITPDSYLIYDVRNYGTTKVSTIKKA
ncbi:MAG: 16S rRNA (guanine(966)-N(2))-methyltransferase RsmD [Rhodospirillaceae bacterium]|nr:16S rRNA (guanine(966)-N(2))-methyltransferase RsmD [Rhodospirillaceae bacterium]